MQQSSNAIEERFWHALKGVRDRLAEHNLACSERVEEAEAAARGDGARFGEASQELARVRRELADLEEARERLPFEAYRANMDGDAELEAQLRKRHQEIKPE
ncbi:MAG: hypothetical protein M3R38_25310, partial [Actinomycetota bacterium]|nr:hypothetical protein [Actinomycetota bacterium]